MPLKKKFKTIFFFGEMVLDFALRKGCAMTQISKLRGGLLDKVMLVAKCC